MEGGISTVEFGTGNGSAYEEFARVAAAAAADERRASQLTFDIFVSGDKRPHVGALKVKGELPLPRDLKRGTRMTVTVSTPEGEIIAREEGVVDWPAFKSKEGIVTRTETIEL